MKFSVFWTFLIALIGIVPAQTVEISIVVKQAGGGEQALSIGFAPGATDGFDIGLDVIAPPPPPQAFFAYLLWKNNGYFKDFRNIQTTPDTFRVRYYRENSSSAPVVIRWNSAALPGNRFFTITDDFDLNLFSMDMRSTDSLVADDHPILYDQLRIIAERDPAGIDLPGEIARTFSLAQNYPNPFNPQTVIEYRLPEVAQVQLAVFDAAGKRVAVLVDARQFAGNFSVSWDGRSDAGVAVQSGVYFCRLIANDFSMVRKMLFLR